MSTFIKMFCKRAIKVYKVVEKVYTPVIRNQIASTIAYTIMAIFPSSQLADASMLHQKPSTKSEFFLPSFTTGITKAT